MGEWVQPEHREVHDYLLHWGRYVRVSYPQGHCWSIEHRYRSPQCWYPPDPKPAPVNATWASLVERNMRIVPRVSRRLLKFKYVDRADHAWIRRRLHLRDFDPELYKARQIIKNLTSELAVTSIRFHNPEHSEFSLGATCSG
jgi:hypothetical protein